ncbi:DUF1929 domain-containing protein [Jiangella ureilytica]|uniref:DUF1929 domain-containing protein n=2 Tax=Jiangella ureilytica TaxID=2530374 RepID=A0A4R4RGH2_9ACTN|nr:DUF1929 domain-containing protein [Jiangella ureilytica]
MGFRMTEHRASAQSRLARWFVRRFALLLALILAAPVLTALPGSAAVRAASEPGDTTLNVLLFYKPNFHASHVQARQAVRELAAELGTQYGQTVEITETDQPTVFTEEGLAGFDTLVFAQTGGILFNDAQRTALKEYIQGGGGWMGIHYAGWSAGTVSEHDVNPWYLGLLGAVSEGHPENPAIRSATVRVSEPGHPLAAGLPDSFVRSDEWYDWNVNPAQNVRTILEVDETTYTGGHHGSKHPVTWCQEYDGGRSWYTAMGHDGPYFAEPVMRTQIRNGLAYTAGLLPADCSPPAKDHAGEWSPVTPWPLMAINMALTHDGKIQSFGSTPTGCTDGTAFDWSGNECVAQGGQFMTDVWDPDVPRTLLNLAAGLVPNGTYTDLFCSMQVHDPSRRAMLTVGGDDSLGVRNDPVNGAVGVTSFSTRSGLRNEAPMNEPRWYPTGTVMPNGDIVVQGGSVRGVAGPGVLMPERYSPDEGSGWTLLTGAESAAAYGDGGGELGPDENRWWYPRAFVAPGNGNLFNITGTQLYELDPSGTGTLTLRGRLPENIANQGELGNPVGATSTAVMYRPGKILQVGGGWWGNGGGPAGARAGFTVDLMTDGGTAEPVIEATEPMRYPRHWANSTVLPTGEVLVTGGGNQNNGGQGIATVPEIWNPDTGEWTSDLNPYAHARLYHSTALLLPDGRVMIAGGGAPGPRNYTDAEFYSPPYLFDGDELAVRPDIVAAPDTIGYDGTFDVEVSGDVAKVALIRNGSVTHGFNNAQSFEELEFARTSEGEITVQAPADGTYAPPGAYMLFVLDADGTPSVAEIVEIDPETVMDTRTPLVDQFEYPRVPAEWRAENPPMTIEVGAGDGRMAPWSVDSTVELVRGLAPGMGGLGVVGYHLDLGESGSLTRTIDDLVPGREYRISLRYARDSRVSVPADGTVSADLSIGSLDATITATADEPSGISGIPRPSTFGTYVGTFTATARSEPLTLTGSGTSAGVIVDDLTIVGVDPGVEDVPIHYTLDEGEGTTAANTGHHDAAGAATLTGAAGWTSSGVHGAALDLPGGDADYADLPDGLLSGAEDFTVSMWANPDSLKNWMPLFQIGNGTDTYFLLQSQTQADGPTGLAATFKAQPPGGGAAVEERLTLGNGTDLTPGEWTHVAFTMQGSTGTLYLNGEEAGTRDDFSLGLENVGNGETTADNFLGNNEWPDPSFAGLIDDVRAYDSALTAADIAVLHADGAAVATTTSLTVTPSPSPFGAPVTVSATVSADGGAAASGFAELWVEPVRPDDPVDLNQRQGDPVALSAEGTVTFPPVQLPARGDYTIQVRYLGTLGEPGTRASEASVTHTVERPPPGEGIPVHYTFDEGQGRTAANSGTDPTIGAATLGGTTGWATGGPRGGVVTLPGGGATTENFVRLPNNLTASMEDEITVSLWARPSALPNWVPLFQIGNGTDTFLLLQSRTNSGSTGFGATLKAPGNPLQERLTLGGANDLTVGEWTHVVFTMSGSTGKLYFDGELMGTRTDFTLGIDDVGQNGNTTSNYIGNNDWPDSAFSGQVDDVRIYAHALSDEDVLELFEGEPAGPLVTTAAAAPAAPDGADGWYVTAPAVTLSATGGTGTVTTEYAFGSGEWTAYTGPITVPDGVHSLRYRSSDSAGVVEEEKTLDLKVDATAPSSVLTGVSDGASHGLHEILSVTASGSDAGSGLASFELLLDGEPVESPLTLDLAALLAGSHSLSAVAVDAAGNETAQTAAFTVVVSFDTVGSLVERYRMDGLVTNSQRQRMLAHLQTAEAAAGRGQVRQADQAVQRFASEALGVIDATARSRLLTAAETLRDQLSP